MIIVNEGFFRNITNDTVDDDITDDDTTKKKKRVISLAKLAKVVEEDFHYKAGLDCFCVEDSTKNNPLHILAANDDLRPFKYMFKNIAKCPEWINESNASGKYPIDIAIEEKSNMVVNFLQQNGATLSSHAKERIDAISKEMKLGDYWSVEFNAPKFSPKLSDAASSGEIPSGSARRPNGSPLSTAVERARK